MHARAKAVGERLKALILEKGWNQSELARRAGMRPSNVSNYLRGTNVPNPTQLAKLAAALGTTAGDLLGASAALAQSGAPNSLYLTEVEDEGRLRLQVDQVVPADLARQVIGLLLTRVREEQTAPVADLALPANDPHAEEEEAPQPRRFGTSILDTLLPANPPKPVNAKQVRQLDGPVAVEEQRTNRKVL
jgi:transcriptional regulator with XRE-family HTH domain